ncbi:MAG: 1,4-dihydroxy-2-naphthoyl-CoA synthase [Acidimicrobiales bacterium]|nr:MAG: enoyl-CoA hydratase/isomerase family protein [Actinomycetota bacterium]MBV6507487.1 1,4-dihydroxy-2-naphthoyl-CoA synthase [Acidimicrobiales bacterium]RIK07864.1 MAG: enoyl-CoA hydratase/isomerase family protein [Acidobacteriota bacterium]
MERSSPPQWSTIKVTDDGTVGRITLDRPDKLNPLGPGTLQELIEAAAWFDRRDDIKAVVIGGAGRAFSAGFDMGTFANPPENSAPRDIPDLGRHMADAVGAMAPVTIARIHGHCVGGGVVLAAACDLRVAAEDTRFSIPEVALGIPLAWGGIPRLVREIGPAMTRELVMTCRAFSAGEAKDLGFVNRVVASEELDRAVDDLTSSLIDKSAFTLRATKRQVIDVLDQMAGPGAGGDDSAAIIGAMRDPESMEVARRYLEGLDDR